MELFCSSLFVPCVGDSASLSLCLRWQPDTQSNVWPWNGVGRSRSRASPGAPKTPLTPFNLTLSENDLPVIPARLIGGVQICACRPLIPRGIGVLSESAAWRFTMTGIGPQIPPATNVLDASSKYDHMVEKDLPPPRLIERFPIPWNKGNRSFVNLRLRHSTLTYSTYFTYLLASMWWLLCVSLRATLK